MVDIDKLLSDRSKIHGNAPDTHQLAYNIFRLLDGAHFNKMNWGSRGMLFLVCIKLVRGISAPSVADHWDDIMGYSELIKRCESEGSDYCDIELVDNGPRTPGGL